MNIIKRNLLKKHYFCDLDIGDLFTFAGDDPETVLMKTDKTNSAISLKTGSLFGVSIDKAVCPVVGSIAIYSDRK